MALMSNSAISLMRDFTNNRDTCVVAFMSQEWCGYSGYNYKVVILNFSNAIMHYKRS